MINLLNQYEQEEQHNDASLSTKLWDKPSEAFLQEYEKYIKSTKSELSDLKKELTSKKNKVLNTKITSPSKNIVSLKKTSSSKDSTKEKKIIKNLAITTLNVDLLSKKYSGFNKDKYTKTISQLSKQNILKNISPRDNNVLKSILIAEYCMDKKSAQTSMKPTRETLEKLYVFDEVRDAAFSSADPVWGEMKSWGLKKIQQSKDYLHGKSDLDHSFGYLQINARLFLKFLSQDTELQSATCQAIDIYYKNNQIAQKFKTILEDKTLNEKQKHEILCSDHDLVSFALKLERDLGLNWLCGKKLLEKNREYCIQKFGKNQNTEDVDLFTILAHLKGAGRDSNSILQQNIFLLSKALNIRLYNPKTDQTVPFQIDGVIGQDTKKLLNAIVNNLQTMGVPPGNIINIINNNNVNFIDDEFGKIQTLLNSRGNPYQYIPHLSFLNLKSSQMAGETHFRYGFIYLYSHSTS